MKQLVMEGPRKSRIVDVPVPEISGAQLLVKVTLTGMCHSEWYPWSTAKMGDMLGHEDMEAHRDNFIKGAVRIA